MPYLQLGYKRLHYTDYEPEGRAKATFLFSHGLGSSQNYYGAVVPHLLIEGYRCITYDKTGAGRSSYTFVPQSVESLAKDAIGILQVLHVSKAIFVGHSMGGIEAAYLAANYPDRIPASVWIGPVLPSPDAAAVFEKRIATVEKEGMEAMANSIPQSATARDANPLARAMIRELLLSQDPRGYIGNCRVIASAKPQDYGSIKNPVLILAGDEDKSAPLEGCQRLYELVGTEKKSLEVMKGVGHWHCLEEPERVAKLIIDWYQQLP